MLTPLRRMAQTEPRLAVSNYLLDLRAYYPDRRCGLIYLAPTSTPTCCPAEIFRDLVERDAADAGVYALKSGQGYLAVCQLNSAWLPGYTEPVMRMRHLTVSPTLDLSDDTGTGYGAALVDVFYEVVNLCMTESDMAAKHIKFHLPSPADRTFFAAVGRELHSKNVFASVEARGAWLYISF